MENDERRQLLSVTMQPWRETDSDNPDLMYREGVEVILWQTGDEELAKKRFTSNVYIASPAGRFKTDKAEDVAAWISEKVYEAMWVELAPEA